MSDALEEFVRRLPKVELHLHLEGAMRPQTLLELARERGVQLPADDPEGLREWFRFGSFRDFIPVYLTCCRCLREPEDFQRLVRELMEDQARQNVRYTEAHLTISTHRNNGVNPQEIRQAAWEEAVAQERRLGVRLRFITDIVRNVGPREGEHTLRWALEGREEGVVAIGLSGSEGEYPPEPFEFHFRTAAEEGLPRVVHAGEQAGPESIRATWAVCDPHRIGHGIRAAEDPALMEQLIEKRLPLEICPTSNVALGVVPSLEQHPIATLREAGVPLSVHSDDPLFFDVSLTEELLGLQRAFSYDAEDLAELSLAALGQSLLPPEERKDRAEEFRGEFATLGEQLLGYPVEPAVPTGEEAASV